MISSKKSVSVNVALLKDGYWKKEEYLNPDSINEVSDEKLSNGVVHWVKVSPQKPSWVKKFFEEKVLNCLSKQHAKALYVIEQKLPDLNGRTYKFALSFGHGKYLLNAMALEMNFGRRIVMNLMDENNVTQIRTKGLGGNQNIKVEQNYMFDDFATFSFDQDSDFLTGIKIKTSFEQSNDIVGSVTGRESIQFSTRRNYEDIGHALKTLIYYYEQKRYKKKFPFLDDVQSVRDKKKIENLDNELLNKIKKQSNHENILLYPPEIIDKVTLYSFDTSKSKIIYDHPSYAALVDYLQQKKDSIENVAELKKRRLYGWNEESDSKPFKSWQIYKALSTELQYEEIKYYLFDGEWLFFSNSLENRVNEDYEKISPYEKHLPAFKVKENYREKDYNQDIVNTFNDMVLFDESFVNFKGNSKMEICDLFHKKRNELIHVKRGHGISAISAVCRQANQSIDYLMDDRSRASLIKNENFAEMKNFLENFSEEKKTVVLVIISSNNNTLTRLPSVTFLGRMLIRSLKQTLGKANLDLKILGVNEVKE